METALTRENVLDYLKSRIKDDSRVEDGWLIVYAGDISFSESDIGDCSKSEFLGMLRTLHADYSIKLYQPNASLIDGKLPVMTIGLR